MLARAWEFLAAGNAIKALEAYDSLARRIEDIPNYQQRGILYINRAHALAALGRFADAAESALTADRMTALCGKTGMRYLTETSQLYWLAGEQRLALDFAIQDVDSIISGKTRYADFGGGSANALNLLFIAHRLDAAQEQLLALDHMRKRAASGNGNGWPRPVALHVLGLLSYCELLQSASSASSLHDALLRSQNDPIVKRHLPVALFYAALKSALDGQHLRRIEQLKACNEITATVPALEWYSARAELEIAQAQHKA